MDQQDKARRLFLYGAIAMGLLIVGGLIWVVAMGPGEGGGTIDPNIVFNDDMNPTLGPADAKVTVRIFSDFQCPACKVAEGPLRQIMEKYQDRVRFVWNDFPLTNIHANAQSAAVAGRCAQEQNKFWEYSDRLYANQNVWSALNAPLPQYTALAQELGLEKDKFASCTTRETPQDKVKQDMLEGQGMGIEATPTFFVNRRKLEGARDFAAWQSVLDEALR